MRAIITFFTFWVHLALTGFTYAGQTPASYDDIYLVNTVLVNEDDFVNWDESDTPADEYSYEVVPVVWGRAIKDENRIVYTERDFVDFVHSQQRALFIFDHSFAPSEHKSLMNQLEHSDSGVAFIFFIDGTWGTEDELSLRNSNALHIVEFSKEGETVTINRGTTIDLNRTCKLQLPAQGLDDMYIMLGNLQSAWLQHFLQLHGINSVSTWYEIGEITACLHPAHYGELIPFLAEAWLNSIKFGKKNAKPQYNQFVAVVPISPRLYIAFHASHIYIRYQK